MTCELQRPVMNSEIGRNFEKLPSVAMIRERVEDALANNFGRTVFDNRVNLHPAGTSKSQHGMLILPNTVWHDASANNTVMRFAGQLSTYPNKVGTEINQVTLSGKCESFSKELQRSLKKEAINSTVVEGLWLTHYSLRTSGSEGEVIIDPTVGQYLSGFNHVFVGLRNELKSIVLDHSKQEKLSYIDTSREYKKKIIIRSDPVDFFENQWPSLSKGNMKVRSL